MADPDPILSSEEAQAFRRTMDAVRQSVLQQAARKPRDTGELVSQLQDGIDRIFEAVRQEDVPVACKAGCSYCCSARVEAFAPEIFIIVEELQRLPAEAYQAVVKRLQAHAGRVIGTSPWKVRPQCPFLVDSLCSIYAVRPSACRRGHSLAVAPCEAGAAQIPQSLKIRIGAAALTNGTLQAYAELGYDTVPHELISAVLLAIDDPTAKSRWLAGENPFAARDHKA